MTSKRSAERTTIRHVPGSPGTGQHRLARGEPRAARREGGGRFLVPADHLTRRRRGVRTGSRSGRRLLRSRCIERSRNFAAAHAAARGPVRRAHGGTRVERR